MTEDEADRYAYNATALATIAAGQLLLAGYLEYAVAIPSSLITILYGKYPEHRQAIKELIVGNFEKIGKEVFEDGDDFNQFIEENFNRE